MINIDENIKEAIQAKSVKTAHAAVQGLITKDRELIEFETPTFVEYANNEFAKQGESFFVEDDANNEFPNKENWDNDLWRTMCVHLEYNFSKKKFDFIIEIMKHLRETGHSDFQYVKSINVKNENIISKETSFENSKKQVFKYTIIGATVGGVFGFAAGAAIGTVIGHSLLGAAVGSLILGGIGYKKDKN